MILFIFFFQVVPDKNMCVKLIDITTKVYIRRHQWCYAVGAGGSAAPIVFLTVGAPLPYFFKWAEYN